MDETGASEERGLPRLPAHRRVRPIDLDEADAQRLRGAYENGRSIRAIATDTGRSYGWVHETLRLIGVAFRPRGGQSRQG